MKLLWDRAAYLLLFISSTFGVSVHHSLTKNELSHVFGVDDVTQVPAYSIVLPRTLPVRSKRNSGDDDDHFSAVSFEAFGETITLHLSRNKELHPLAHTIEFYGENGTVKKYTGASGSYSFGTVADDPDSVVAVEEKYGGISGLILTNDEVYAVHPVPKRLDTQYSSDDQHGLGSHILYRQSDLPQGHPAHKLSCGFQSDELMFRTEPRSESGAEHRSRREAYPLKTMELMVAADYSMVEFYGKEFLQSYLLSMTNIVASLFQDVRLSYPMSIAVTRIAIFETNRFNASNMNMLLAGFSEWVRQNNPTDDADPNHVDNALLLTRNGCVQCGLSGLAYSSLCIPATSQATANDVGLMTALTCAHELAHNLGLQHDGTNGCPDQINIMSTAAASGSRAFEFSPCSASSLKATLLKPQSSCYNDLPSKSLSNSSFFLYGQVFNGNRQCEMAFGSKYKKCSQYEENCGSLYCQLPPAQACVVLPYPAAHGTYCGANKWCVYGECVPDGTPLPKPSDGGWGSWGPYEPCSKECGIGVQWLERLCNNPAPANGGLDCQGSSRGQYKTCNTQGCPKETPNSRLVQCQQKEKNFVNFFDVNLPCHLVCGIPTEAYYFGWVADGTRCDPDGKSYDVCIQGSCMSVGCDLELESGSVVDRCGKCRGDGSSCQFFNNSDYNAYSSQGEHLLANIPAYSNNIVVKEVGGTFNFIGFKVEGNSELAIRLPSYSQDYDLQGVKVSYKMEGFYFPDVLSIVDPLPVGISVYLVNFYLVRSEGVTWQYYGGVTGAPVVSESVWSSGEWSACSKTCAGGTQTRRLTCKRKDDLSLISLSLCDRNGKPEDSRQCNTQSCPPEWHISDWGPCSRSCGNGTRIRDVFCAELSSAGAFVRALGTDERCSATEKPAVSLSESCNAVSCPAEWSLGSWSSCSTTCGIGSQNRPVSCQRRGADGIVVQMRELACVREPKPIENGICNGDTPCPEWKVVYSKCSVTCGEGVKTPTVICTVPPSDQAVAVERCNVATKPATGSLLVQRCNENECVRFRWVSRQGTCSVTCGNGLIPVTVECRAILDSAVVPDERCVASEKPTGVSQPCYAGVCPEVFLWGTKTSCSKSCGTGVQTTIAYCVKKSDGSAADDRYCNAAEKPSVQVSSCVQTPCPASYEWKVVYDECSVTCGTGIEKAYIKCEKIVEDTRDFVLDASCTPNRKPTPVDRVCTANACPLTYSWKIGFGSCSVTCGPGTQSPVISCNRDQDGVEMTDSACDPASRPTPEGKECNLGVCPSPNTWRPTYGSCSASCGNGTRVKILECVDRATGRVIENTACTGLDKPSDRLCLNQACIPTFTFRSLPPSYALGCFADNPIHRRLPFLRSNLRQRIRKWKEHVDRIEMCARTADAAGDVFYSVQFFGECWTGNSASENTFYLDGESDRCNHGIGELGANFVYKLGAPPDFPTIPAIIKLGCFADDLRSPRPLPDLIDNLRYSALPMRLQADEIVMKCARAARRRNLQVFAIQYFAECWSGSTAFATYMRAGPAENCYLGLGSVNSYFVYAFESS